LCPDGLEDRFIAPDRVRNIRLVIRRQLWPKRGEIADGPCVALQDEPGGFAKCESPMELLRDKPEDIVTVSSGHGDDEFGISGDPRSQLSCGEVGCITAQLGKDSRCNGLNRTSDHRVATCARNNDVMQRRPCAVCNCESLRDRRAANVSCADEQYAQRKLLEESPDGRFPQAGRIRKARRARRPPSPTPVWQRAPAEQVLIAPPLLVRRTLPTSAVNELARFARKTGLNSGIRAKNYPTPPSRQRGHPNASLIAVTSCGDSVLT